MYGDAETYRVGDFVGEDELSGLGSSIESVPVDDLSVADVCGEVDDLAEAVVGVHCDMRASFKNEAGDARVDVHLALRPGVQRHCYREAVLVLHLHVVLCRAVVQTQRSVYRWRHMRSSVSTDGKEG